ncbi:unnamed protein product [Parascedosporium putredinis]|uniref:Uncharacterized protein n=1 Tax=Parascedosporium putredinis TaxID=1442378 RepID=A0A9P1HD14_9PEZI|nr:unnamed protein product [Parascedosporium putredinis]CAI8004976.1 unnamed protein product [Parascedosporium putredinis]
MALHIVRCPNIVATQNRHRGPGATNLESLASPSYFPPPHQQQQQQRPGSSSTTSEKPNPTTHLTSHLTNLPHLIRESREAHHESRTASDLALVSLVIPHVEALLHRFATRPVLPALAELTVRRLHLGLHLRLLLLPSASSSSAAAAAFNPSNPWQTRNEFDDWGRWGDDLGGGASSRNSPEALWWNDEELATRLARHLQPRHASVPHRAPPGAIPSPAPTGVLTKEEPRPAPVPAATSRWSIFKSPDPVTPSPKPSPSFYYHAQQQQMGFPPLPSEEAVVMTVKAEEVTFRKENAFGIWESKNGYGLVVRVRTRR